ncbi:hypothetical protein [Streptomyces sp. QHH-9511]|uniref:hypothetical protein n=1 Tax=Streptomyces sp. QHH-9511 TaxID=2684468 RepID=UPI0018E0B10C|nr:hypothetical protein [Streptomyces sp. QHH-9511]
MMKTNALPGTPRWAALAAHAVPLIVIPSGIWRIALTLGAPVAEVDDPGLGQDVYQIVLTVVAELLAFLTLGLVRSWGEVFPRRLPFVGGRPVSTRGATTAALCGAFGLFALVGWFTYAAYAGLGQNSVGTHTDGPVQEVLLYVCYLPLLAWGPLLAAVAVAYRRRRTGRYDSNGRHDGNSPHDGNSRYDEGRTGGPAASSCVEKQKNVARYVAAATTRPRTAPDSTPAPERPKRKHTR